MAVLKTDAKGFVGWSKWHLRRPNNGGLSKSATHQEAREFLVDLGFQEVEHKYTEDKVLGGGDCIGGIKCRDEWQIERSAYTHLSLYSKTFDIKYDVFLTGVYYNQTYLTIYRSDYKDLYWKMGLNFKERTHPKKPNEYMKLEHLWDVVRVFPKDLTN